MMLDFLHRCPGVKGHRFGSLAIDGGKFMFMSQISLLAKELVDRFCG